MKFGKKLAAWALAMCMGLSMAATGVLGADLDGKMVVLVTANVRADLDVLPKAAALKADYAVRGAAVVLADAGNFLQGTVYATADSGETVVALMDAAGYDVAALGGYEFAFGTGQVVSNHGTVYADGSLGEFLAETNVAGISANVLSGGENAYAPSAVLTAGGKKIGVFGITDTKTVNMVAESSVRGLSFTDGAAAARVQAEALKDCDVVVGLSNLGTLTAVEGAVVVDIAADKGLTVLAVTLDAAGKEISRENIDLSKITPDASILALVNAYRAEVDAEYAGKVAKSSVYLNGAQKSVRAGESNLGNFWADALRWFAVEGNIAAYYDEDDIANGNTGIQVDADHVIALWNGGNLRDSIQPGDVTQKDIARVLPYPNQVAVVYLTGAQLLEHLEATSQALPYAQASASASSSFMHASGIKYTVAASMEYKAGTLYRTNWYKAAGINRVTVQSVNGKAFDPKALYAVVTSNANYNGMDASYVCLEKDADKSAITSALVTDVIWMYIQEKLGGEIGSAYAATEGRVTVTTSYTDVRPVDWFAGAVNFVTQNGIMRGVSDGKFEPEAFMTRAQLVAALYALAGAPAVEEGVVVNFTDVPEDAWYAKAVAWAVSTNVTSGTSATTFNPNGLVSRQEMAVFIYRAGGSPEVTAAIPAPDAAFVSAWARDAVAYFYESGYGDIMGKLPFAPKTNITRSIAAYVLMELATR